MNEKQVKELGSLRVRQHEVAAGLAPFTIAEIAWELEQRRILEQLNWQNVMRPTGRKLEQSGPDAHANVAFWAGYKFFIHGDKVWKLLTGSNMLHGWEMTQFTADQVG
jgi:hypothetical protein